MMKKIDAHTFRQHLTAAAPDSTWPEALQCLWYDAKDDWEASHDIAQDMHNNIGSWLHAYLHRKEGDDWNAGYWYRKAGKSFPKMTLEEEFEVLLQEVLKTTTY